MTIVFIGPKGQPPQDAPVDAGQTAINQQTGEKWFVNLSLQWQQQVGV